MCESRTESLNDALVSQRSEKAANKFPEIKLSYISCRSSRLYRDGEMKAISYSAVWSCLSGQVISHITETRDVYASLVFILPPHFLGASSRGPSKIQSVNSKHTTTNCVLGY